MNIRHYTYIIPILMAVFIAGCSDSDDGLTDGDGSETTAMPMTFGGSLGEGEEGNTPAKVGQQNTPAKIGQLNTPAKVGQQNTPARVGQQAGYRAMTRAAGLETVATSFTVYGKKAMAVNDKGTADAADDVYSSTQNVFPGYTVNYDAATNGWTYENTTGQTLKYWDMMSKAYLFAAYAYDKGATTPTAVRATYTDDDRLNFNFEAMCNTADEIKNTPYVSEKWFSNGSAGSKLFGEPVTLEFMQPFCQVRFMLVDEESKPLTKTSPTTPFLSNIGFGQTDNRFGQTNNNEFEGYIPTQVTVNVDYLMNSSEAAFSFTAPVDRLIPALTVPYESNVNAADYAFATVADKEKWYTLVPYTKLVPYHLTLDYRGEPREAVVPLEYLDWKPGYRYTYVFKVGYEGTVNYAPELYTYTKWEAGYSETTEW